MTNKYCSFCGDTFTGEDEYYCGKDCKDNHRKVMSRVQYSTDDGYDAWRDSRLDRYNPRDWRWGSWDK